MTDRAATKASIARDPANLLDMLIHARRAARKGADRRTLMEEPDTRDAVAHCLAQLGAAAQRVSEASKTQHPDLDWETLGELPDKLVTNYRNVDWEDVWRNAVEPLPELIARLEKVVPEEG